MATLTAEQNKWLSQFFSKIRNKDGLKDLGTSDAGGLKIHEEEVKNIEAAMRKYNKVRGGINDWAKKYDSPEIRSVVQDIAAIDDILSAAFKIIWEARAAVEGTTSGEIKKICNTLTGEFKKLVTPFNKLKSSSSSVPDKLGQVINEFTKLIVGVNKAMVKWMDRMRGL